jgi:cytoskeletal protein CcmA (bactofilin family)
MVFEDQTELKLEGKTTLRTKNGVDVDFYSDVRFHDDVTVDDELKVYGHAYFDEDVDVTGYLNVDHVARFHGDVTMFHNVRVEKNLTVQGSQIYSGDVEITGKLLVGGLFTANRGALVKTGYLNDALKVYGTVKVTKELTTGTLIVDGTGATGTQVAVLNGDILVNGIITADDFIPAVSSAGVDIDIIIEQLFILIQDSTINVGGINIAGEPALTISSMVTDMKQIDLEVRGLTTLTLAVEETATVGDEPILTTADALLEGSEVTSAATTTTQCGCTSEDVLVLLSQAESVQMNSLNVINSLQLNQVNVATELYADQCRCDASDLGLDGSTTSATSTSTECGCSDTDILTTIESATSLRLQSIIANSYMIWVDSDSQVTVPDQRDLDSLESDLRSAISTTGDGSSTCSCTADDITGLGFASGGGGGCDCGDLSSYAQKSDIPDLSDYVSWSEFSSCACLPPE